MGTLLICGLMVLGAIAFGLAFGKMLLTTMDVSSGLSVYGDVPETEAFIMGWGFAMRHLFHIKHRFNVFKALRAGFSLTWTDIHRLKEPGSTHMRRVA